LAISRGSRPDFLNAAVKIIQMRMSAVLHIAQQETEMP
jgi:hypothetical protein